ncbi:MAG TPA: hypothetical protein VMQ17_06850 [Candidatus Sulfotelmatobacter sp.]|jgi:hypothetical protein|nr:hypothetical protein [Candidatus Sulfotelmatobacter sp.]
MRVRRVAQPAPLMLQEAVQVTPQLIAGLGSTTLRSTFLTIVLETDSQVIESHLPERIEESFFESSSSIEDVSAPVHLAFAASGLPIPGITLRFAALGWSKWACRLW